MGDGIGWMTERGSGGTPDKSGGICETGKGSFWRRVPWEGYKCITVDVPLLGRPFLSFMRISDTPAV